MISKRVYEPIGIVLATDEGLLTLEPGGTPKIVVDESAFTDVDYYDGIGIAGSLDLSLIHI